MTQKNTKKTPIPEDWIIESVCQFGEIITGSTPPTKSKEYWDGNIPWVTPTDISNNRDIYKTEREITSNGLSVLRKLSANSVLITCIASIGKNAILKREGACNQQINAIVPNQEHNPEFLYYLFENSKKYLLSHAGITATNIISKKDFAEIIYTTPFLPEQTAIATVLSDTDTLIEKLKKLIAKKKAIKQGATQQLLTGKKRLPGFSGKWDKKQMQEIGKTYGGLSGKVKADFGNGNSRYIPFMNIMSNPIIDITYFDKVNIKTTEIQAKAQKNDLFFNSSSETPEEVGMCSVLLKEIPNLYLNSFCFGFRLNKDLKTDGLWLSYFFRSSIGRELIYSLAQGATRYNLSKTNFLKLEIPYPEAQEQNAIATVLSDMNAEIEKLENKLNKYYQIKTGMMQQLLTGKIRLIKE